MRLAGRVVVALVLLGVLVGLCVHYGAVEPDRGPYPTTDELDADYDAYVGESMLVFGDVTEIDESTDWATITVSTTTGEFDMTVTGFTATVQPGGVVQVYGTLEPDRTIAASNVEVVNPAGSSKLYKYGVSAVGAALVLVLFFRSWKLDRESIAFEVRSDG